MTPDPREVARIVEPPLARFLPTAPIAIVERTIDGWPLRYGAYDVDGLSVWGATARILSQLGAVLRWAADRGCRSAATAHRDGRRRYASRRMKHILLRARKDAFEVRLARGQPRPQHHRGQQRQPHLLGRGAAHPHDRHDDVTADRFVIDPGDAERINERYDAYVIPLANAFRPSYEPTLVRLTQLIRRLRIPVVILGRRCPGGRPLSDRAAAPDRACRPRLRGGRAGPIAVDRRARRAHPRLPGRPRVPGRRWSSAARRCSSTATACTWRSGDRPWIATRTSSSTYRRT